MLYDEVLALYNRSRLMHYRTLFGHIHEKDGSLSATEAFAADVIYLLGEPSIKEFSDHLGISQPNATYKVNSLISKGYIEKLPPRGDRRETRIRVCNKYFDYSGEQDEFIRRAVEALESSCTHEELAAFEKTLSKLSLAVEAENRKDTVKE